MYVTMALEYERKCTLLCMLDQTRKTPLLSQHHDEGTPICIAALENYPYLAYLQKKIWLRHPYPTPPSYRNFWSGEGTLEVVRRPVERQSAGLTSSRPSFTRALWLSKTTFALPCSALWTRSRSWQPHEGHDPLS